MEPRAQFAANLRSRRLAAGYTQEDLSGRSGLHSAEISRLERGARDPRLSTIVRLARALDIAASELVADVG